MLKISCSLYQPIHICNESFVCVKFNHTNIPFMWFVAVISGGGTGVKIKELSVPPTYVLDEEPNAVRQPLILDCEYEVDPGESGFVLKWLRNEQPVYQWIPGSKPFPLSFLRGRVDTKYEASVQSDSKHRAVAIIRPQWNMSGEYACSVQTFQSQDRKSAHLLIVVPDKDFQLSYNCCDDENFIVVECSTLKVFPEPSLTLTVNDMLVDTGTEKKRRKEDGMYESILTWRVPKSHLDPPVTFNCALTIPGTNYTARRETIYYATI
uniref:Ig-like domain-containing protein n=1 Tax=Lutzomyia longipalpis TaxID=7200 RepID=A0A1B0CWG0_LUTLO